MQFGWPRSVPLTYASPVPQAVHAASPALEKVFGAHALQFVLFVAEQGVAGKVPAAQTEHAAQGARPEAL